MTGTSLTVMGALRPVLQKVLQRLEQRVETVIFRTTQQPTLEKSVMIAITQVAMDAPDYVCVKDRRVLLRRVARSAATTW